MSDASNDPGAAAERGGRLGQRQAVLGERSANPLVRLLTGGVLLAAISGGATLILAHGALQRAVTADASQAETMQEPAAPETGLEFGITDEPAAAPPEPSPGTWRP